jgi:hypothetical protein
MVSIGFHRDPYGSFFFDLLLEGEQGWVRIHRFCEYQGEEGERYLGRGSLRVLWNALRPF